MCCLVPNLSSTYINLKLRIACHTTMASSSSYSGRGDRGKGTLTDISASCLDILAAMSSSRTIDHSVAASRGTKKRKSADTEAADQGILHKRPLRIGACEQGHQRYYCKECGGAGICEHGRERYSCKECGGAIKKKQ